MTHDTQRIAITGGTGFVGRHFAELLRDARARAGRPLATARAGRQRRRRAGRSFAGCDAVAHLAGINRELGDQTYARVHVDGTRNVVAAAALRRA